jgi:hypothetical membrane protein
VRIDATDRRDEAVNGYTMPFKARLLFGPAAAAVLGFAVFGLALLLPGYSQVRQTVSEIGEVDSPARLPFTVCLCAVGACLAVFAWGVRDVSKANGRSPLAAYLITAAGISAAGVGIFSFPHPLHNVFGQSELIGYQAPLAFALTWRRDPRAQRWARFSWAMFALVWVAIALNLTTLYRHGPIWTQMKPVYGVAQRALFASWFGWIVGIGVMLFRDSRQARIAS